MKHVLCIGNAVQDFVFATPTIPTRPEKYRADAFDTVGGGPAATAAVAIARLGGRASLITRLGDDQVADLIVSELVDYGVDCSLARRFEDRKSSLSSVFVDRDGERLIVNYLDSKMPNGTDWLPDNLPGGVDAVLADSRWPAGGMHMLNLANKAGLPAVLDGDVPLPRDSELPGAATHIGFSATGLSEYSGEDDPERGLRKAADKTGAWCSVTLGQKGALHIENGQIHHSNAFSVAVQDTLGAGDVWHGAFALALAESKAPGDALRFAAAAAAAKVRDGAGRSGAPSRIKVEEIMQSSESRTDA